MVIRFAITSDFNTLCGCQGAQGLLPWVPDAARRWSKRLGDLPRKEVIQPHLPVRLPCYDFTPLTRRTFDASFLAVKPAASGAPNSGGVTGGVYKARERIHRSLADLRLLAIPTSCSRVADCSPNWDRLLRIRMSSRTSFRLCRPL